MYDGDEFGHVNEQEQSDLVRRIEYDDKMFKNKRKPI